MSKTEMHINFTGLFITSPVLCTVTQFYLISPTGTLVLRFKIRFQNLPCSWVSRNSWKGVLILIFFLSFPTKASNQKCLLNQLKWITNFQVSLMVWLHVFRIIFVHLRSIRRELRVLDEYLCAGGRTVIRFMTFMTCFTLFEKWSFKQCTIKTLLLFGQIPRNFRIN